jgi:hypothetical protein
MSAQTEVAAVVTPFARAAGNDQADARDGARTPG